MSVKVEDAAAHVRRALPNRESLVEAGYPLGASPRFAAQLKVLLLFVVLPIQIVRRWVGSHLKGKDEAKPLRSLK